MMNYKELAKKAHKHAVDKGFYESNPSDAKLIMEIIGEVYEANTAWIEGNRADVSLYKSLGEHSPYSFMACIKDTFEDELADIAIRLLDFAEYKGWNLEKNSEYTARENQPVHDFLQMLCYEVSSIDYYPCDVIESMETVEAIAKFHDIDLEYHIEEKMKYNATRERLHGKKW